MEEKRTTKLWPFLAMGASIGIVIGVFGERIEEWVETFSFVAEDGWISMIAPGVIAGVVGGLVWGAILTLLSKRSRETSVE